jgi:7-cyano-7-deazaguanine synthase
VFDYGQPHLLEVIYAKRFCVKRNIKLLSMDLFIPASGLLANDGSPVVQGRNLIMLAIGAAEASRMGCDEVWFGATAEDADLFPDCRQSFVDRLNAVMDVTNGPRIAAPLMKKTKREVVDMARELGIQDDETWSCYFPKNTTPQEPCGECLACEVRIKGLNP